MLRAAPKASAATASLMPSGKPPARQGGVTYLALLFFVAASGAALAATGTIWSHERQRDKERELLWIGNQFREAIALYYHRSPGAVKRYPDKLEDLLEDKRHLSTQRYLRKIFHDPMTGKPEWGLVPAPGGGIMGVYSLSDLAPVKIDNFPSPFESFSGTSRYAGWRFIFQPLVAPAKPDAAAKAPLAAGIIDSHENRPVLSKHAGTGAEPSSAGQAGGSRSNLQQYPNRRFEQS